MEYHLSVVDACIKQFIVETKLKQEFDPIWLILYGDVVRGKRRSIVWNGVYKYNSYIGGYGKKK